MLDDIMRITGLRIQEILGAYVFGSMVYGTNDKNSDVDIILISNHLPNGTEIRNGKYNIQVLSESSFIDSAERNDIKSIECLFAPDWAKLVEYNHRFILNEGNLRNEISAKVSNSWVKFKKKLAQGDRSIGLKSLFHSLRIADFGIQVAQGNEINFQSSNFIWDEIKYSDLDWSELAKKYKPLLNSRLTQFRNLAPKNGNK
jgi:predicted nucleotidyltransferase